MYVNQLGTIIKLDTFQSNKTIINYVKFHTTKKKFIQMPLLSQTDTKKTLFLTYNILYIQKYRKKYFKQIIIAFVSTNTFFRIFLAIHLKVLVYIDLFCSYNVISDSIIASTLLK